jgi:outer membrane protein assembly factor BamB
LSLLGSSLLGLGASGCGHKRVAGPPLFPVRTAWTTPVDAAIEPPLALDERRVYVATRDGALRALDRRDGVAAWKVEEGPGQLAAASGHVILRKADGKVTSLQPRNGGLRWSVDSGVRGTIAPVIDGDLLLIAGEGLAALETVTGRLLWSVSDAPTVTSLPVASGARLIVSESDGTLRCRDRATGASLWTFKTKEAIVAPALVDDARRVFVGTTDRRLVRLDLDRGRRAWRWKVGADVSTPPALASSLVLFTAKDATLYAIQRGSGKLAWRAGLPSRPLSGALVVAGTALVACHENELVGFSLRDGKARGSLRVPAEIRTFPLLDRGRLYVGLRNQSVIALALAGLDDETAVR